ncbi:YfhO family protein [Jeotgalibacillus sp. S-D1]|uniref:YfhO family protein n=1 Tax=Jeotgalibacillus sp. S-D1 TaxID=2552189 RepID=UPI0014044BE6|nr:YfhO family protein [Jeotgalibacillus sp. S-D1]
MTIKRTLFLVLAAFAASFFSHFFFLNEWWDDRYMLGPNDGLNQIAPFKELLYNEFTNGSFFYSFSFGIGAGTYSQLGYYYSTNIFFLFSVVIVYLFDSMGFIHSPDALFWAQANVWISVMRVTLIITVTTAVFRYMKLTAVPAFTGASLYAISAIYFRHVVYWDFFADAFLWVPLLVLGVEKIIREKHPVWFIVAVAGMIFTNFYFAYINLIFIAIYIAFRSVIKLVNGETPFKIQCKHYIFGGLLGFGMGSIGFVPAVYGYFNNYRPPYEEFVPIWNFADNILFTSLTLLVPPIFILFMWVGSFYKNKLFLLFAAISLFLIILHFSPLAGSVFNGFSAPRNRFEYLAYFAIGGATAAGLQLLSKIKLKEFLKAASLTIITYALYYDSYFLTAYSEETNKGFIILWVAGAVAAVFILFGWIRKSAVLYLLMAVIIIGNITVMNNHQRIVLSENGGADGVTRDYLQSGDYMNKKQMELIQQVQQRDDEALYRMDWRGNDNRNNIPVIQEFNGLSSYTSIQNKNILFFYYHDMEIDMGHESVSRYSGLGDRSNLYSLLRGKYLMHEKNKEEVVPYGFKKILENDNYIIYENTNTLPFIKTTSNLYDEDLVSKADILSREHAMLDGIVVKDAPGDPKTLNQKNNLLEDVSIKPVNATYKNGQLEVTGEKGGLDIQVGGKSKEFIDLYLSFYLENNDRQAPMFRLEINEFQTLRKSHQSLYRTGVNDITARVSSSETLSLRMREGSYTLEDLELYGENYEKLNEITASATQQDQQVDIGDNRITLLFDNTENNSHAVIPIPYERGWQVKVNGEKQELLEANFAFLGTEIDKGPNKIEFVYYPPYFMICLIIAILSCLITAAWGWLNWRKRKNPRV